MPLAFIPIWWFQIWSTYAKHRMYKSNRGEPQLQIKLDNVHGDISADPFSDNAEIENPFESAKTFSTFTPRADSSNCSIEDSKSYNWDAHLVINRNLLAWVWRTFWGLLCQLCLAVVIVCIEEFGSPSV